MGGNVLSGANKTVGGQINVGPIQLGANKTIGGQLQVGGQVNLGLVQIGGRLQGGVSNTGGQLHGEEQSFEQYSIILRPPGDKTPLSSLTSCEGEDEFFNIILHPNKHDTAN